MGRADRGRRAVRDARDDVFQDRNGGVGNRGGSIVVAAIPILFFNAEAQRMLWSLLAALVRVKASLKNSNTQTLLLGSLSVLAVMFLTLWWMWPRLALDGAVMNRPKIWLAGLQLFAANPMGVGFGNSGEIASAFMLPDGITVRTLVNSHLTLLAGMGALVGGAWRAFIALGLGVGRTMRRTWVAFAGLAVSAFSASEKMKGQLGNLQCGMTLTI